MTKQKPKVYLMLDFIDTRNGFNDPGYGGRILKEDGTLIDYHYSSSPSCLRDDLLKKLDNADDYEVINWIGRPIPEKFLPKVEDIKI